MVADPPLHVSSWRRGVAAPTLSQTNNVALSSLSMHERFARFLRKQVPKQRKSSALFSDLHTVKCAIDNRKEIATLEGV